MMPDFYTLLDERMRIEWENLARETSRKLRQNQLELAEKGLLSSGFELTSHARIRSEAIIDRGERVWLCISETLDAVGPP